MTVLRTQHPDINAHVLATLEDVESRIEWDLANKGRITMATRRAEQILNSLAGLNRQSPSTESHTSFELTSSTRFNSDYHQEYAHPFDIKEKNFAHLKPTGLLTVAPLRTMEKNAATLQACHLFDNLPHLVKFSNDRFNHVLTASETLVSLFDLNAQKVSHTFEGKQVKTATWSTLGSAIYLGEEKGIGVFDVVSGKGFGSRPNDEITGLKVIKIVEQFPDVAFGTSKGSIMVYDVRNWSTPRSISREHSSAINAICFLKSHPNIFYTGDASGTMIHRDLNTHHTQSMQIEAEILGIHSIESGLMTFHGKNSSLDNSERSHNLAYTWNGSLQVDETIHFDRRPVDAFVLNENEFYVSAQDSIDHFQRADDVEDIRVNVTDWTAIRGNNIR